LLKPNDCHLCSWHNFESDLKHKARCTTCEFFPDKHLRKQCLQYLQFLQAWQGSEPVQVAA
jgi:hypothetical protein